MVDVIEYNRSSKAALSKNFTSDEFNCRCGKCLTTLISIKTINILQMIRESIGEAIIINSGFRCEEHNKHVSGAPQSQHMLGKAADISTNSHSPAQLYEIADKIMSYQFPESCGLRLYQTWIHVDSRDKKHRWRYSSVV